MNYRDDENFSVMVVNHKYRMADQFKKFYGVGTIFSPIFFEKDIPVLTPGVIFPRGAFTSPRYC